MENSEAKRIKISWKGIVFLFIAAVITLAFIFIKLANPKEIWAVLHDYPTQYLLLALLTIVLSWFVDALRIKIAIAATGFAVPYTLLVVAMIAIHFLSMITPFTATGVPFLIYILYRYRLSVGQAAGVSTSASLGAQLGLVALVSLILTLMPEIPEPFVPYFPYLELIVVLYGIGVAAAVCLFTHGHRFRSLFERFTKYPNISLWFNTFVTSFRQTFKKRGLYFLGVIICGFCHFALLYLAGCFLLTGIQAEPALSFENYSVAALLGLSPSLTPIPGGAGISEIFSVYMLDDTFTDDRIGAFIILWRAVIFYFPAAAGGIAVAYLLLIWSKKQKPRALDKVAASENCQQS